MSWDGVLEHLHPISMSSSPGLPGEQLPWCCSLGFNEGDFAPWALQAQPLSLQSRAGVCFSCGREAAEWAVGGGRDRVKGGGGVAGAGG